MKLVLATKNSGKVVEFRRLLEELGARNLDVVGLDAFPEIGDIEETGTTFEENSLLKARTICNLTGLPALADDSGICVDALGGAPGLYSARYSGQGDAANNAKLLDALKEVPDADRTAYFICVAAFVRPDGLNCTSAELSAAEKDAISHRGKAMRAIAPYIIG